VDCDQIPATTLTPTVLKHLPLRGRVGGWTTSNIVGIQMPPLALPPSWWPQNAWDSPTRKSPDVTRCHRRCCSTLYCSLSRYAKLKTVPLMLHPICVPVQMPYLNTLVEVASQMMNWCILWRNEGLMPIVHGPYAFLCVCSGMKLSKGSCCGHQANTLCLA
jgi:hypothetical protein